MFSQNGEQNVFSEGVNLKSARVESTNPKLLPELAVKKYSWKTPGAYNKPKAFLYIGIDKCPGIEC